MRKVNKESNNLFYSITIPIIAIVSICVLVPLRMSYNEFQGKKPLLDLYKPDKDGFVETGYCLKLIYEPDLPFSKKLELQEYIREHCFSSKGR